MKTTKLINFGANVVFTPQHFYQPTSVEEVFAILERHRDSSIRAIGSLHAWSPAAAELGVVVSLAALNDVSLRVDSDGVVATVGGGCQIKKLIQVLAENDLAMPALGLISEQTIAGATSTATHGSGRHCLSHYLTAVHVAHYDSVSDKPKITVIRDPEMLRAAKCGMGCFGIIVAVEFHPRASFRIEEFLAKYDSLAEVVAMEEQYPLQQFYYLPWYDRYLGQHRRETRKKRSWFAALYRAYWYCVVDIALHVVLTTIMQRFQKRNWAKAFFRSLAPFTLVKGWRVVDHSSDMLIMEHELFRHIEIELFVRRSDLEDAMQFTRQLITYADSGVELPQKEIVIASSSCKPGVLNRLKGSYTHHYPICVRRVLADDMLISSSTGGQEDYYALSFISYDRPEDRQGFYDFAEVLANVMFAKYKARGHWGKHMPHSSDQIEALYPEVQSFREYCKQFDREGRFRNPWLKEVLFAIPK